MTKIPRSKLEYISFIANTLRKVAVDLELNMRLGDEEWQELDEMGLSFSSILVGEDAKDEDEAELRCSRQNPVTELALDMFDVK